MTEQGCPSLMYSGSGDDRYHGNVESANIPGNAGNFIAIKASLRGNERGFSLPRLDPSSIHRLLLSTGPAYPERGAVEGSISLLL